MAPYPASYDASHAPLVRTTLHTQKAGWLCVDGLPTNGVVVGPAGANVSPPSVERQRPAVVPTNTVSLSRRP